jgi:hypothetical protein
MTVSNPRDLTIAGDQLYLFQDCTTPGFYAGTHCMVRTDLDGAGPTEIARSPWNILWPVVDLASNRVFYQEDFRKLRSSSLLGFERTLLATGELHSDVTPVVVDSAAGWLYYDFESSRRRMHPDGTGDEEFEFACSISGPGGMVAAATTGCVSP